MKPFLIRKIYPVIIFALIVITQNGFSQSSILWSSTGGSAWLTTTNWTGSVVPTSTDIAQMGANPTGAGGIGINMNGTTNNGSNNQALGAFEITSARVTSNPVIGNSSTAASGTLTLLGATVNSVSNVIIRNNSAKDITFQNIQGTGTQTMNIYLTNTTDNKIVQDAAGKIIISAPISGTVGTPITVMGAGTSEVDITNASNSFSGTINLLGSETVFPADGCFGLVPTSVVTNAIIIDGGRMTANATYTLNANRGIKIGNTAGTSISVKTSTTIMTYNGVISDLSTNGSWAKQGGNVFQIGGVSIYTGVTGINNGTLRLINGNDRLPVTTTLNLGQAASSNVGAFDLNGYNQQVAGLISITGTNMGVTKNTITTSTTPATLTLSGAANYTYGVGTTVNSGVITGSVSLVKNGTGLQILGDLNSYTGSTTINSGELRFSPNANENLSSSTMILNGGILSTSGIAASQSLGFSTLNVTNNSIINLESTNTHSLNFASSSSVLWTAAKTLTITGWQGTYNSSTGSAGTVGRIFIGSTASDLTPTQLSQITFFDGTNYYGAILMANGELSPYCIAPVINSISSNTVLCAGTNLNLSASASGTYAPTYLWAGPASFTSNVQNPVITNATGLASGVYTLTTSNACGTFSATTSVTIASQPVVVANTTSTTICSGQQITLSGSGANTYTWSNSVVDGSSFTPTASTVYSVTGTDNNNCTNTGTVSVTVNITPTLSVNASTVCAGTSVTLSASGATSYTWNTSSNSSSIIVTPLSSTNYTLSGSNPGCTSSLTTAITVYSLPVIPVSSFTICAGASATLSASGANSYTWSSGSNSTSISVTPSTTIDYTVSGSSVLGCVNSTTAEILVNPLPVINSSSTSVCAGGTATLSVSGASTYTWSNSSNSTSIVITPTANTNFTITGTSAQGCINSGTTAILLTTSPSISVNSQTICTGNSATLTATGVSNYTWSNGPTTSTISANPTSNNIYTVSGTASGCGALVVSNTVAIIVNPLPTITVNSATICPGNSATLISSGASTYTWNTTSNSATITPSPSATIVYTTTGTSASGCINTATALVVVNSSPTLTANASTICSGASTILVVSGANTYTWNPGNILTNTLSANPSSSTIYTVSGTSTLNCVSSNTVQLTVNNLPVLSVNAPTTCAGSTTTLLANGATSYTWNTTATSASIIITPTANINYSVSGTNSLGCIGSTTVVVTVNPSPSIASASTNVCMGSTGTLTASGASTYTWSTGSTSVSITATPTVNTNYIVAGTSSLGCVNSFTTFIAVTNPPTISVTTSSVCAGTSATLSASGAASYTWDTGSNLATLTVTPSSTTVYSLTGSSSQGCKNSVTTTVVVYLLPNVSLAVSSSSLCVADNSIALTGSPSGGTFSGTGVTGSSFNPAISGAGTFTTMYSFTNQNNCFASATKIISVDQCTGIPVHSLLSNVSIYPNPASDKLMLNTQNSVNCQIEIIDLTGKTLLLMTSDSSGSTQIDLTSFTKGMYVLKVIDRDQIKLIKFIKE